MAMERENYYLMLELPIDPPTEDPGEIRSAIQRKKQEWTRWQDHPGKRALGLANLAALPDIEQVMFDPIARKSEARKALELRDDMMRRMEAELRILEGKGHLLPREVSALAMKYRVYGVSQKTIHELAQVPISEEPPIPKEPEQPGEVLDRLTAKTIARNLTILGQPDLYAFLGEPPYSSIKKLRTAAEQKRRSAASEGKTAASVATQELAGICLRIFENFDSKQLYDRYLRISTHPALGEMIDQEFVRSRYISPVAMMRLVNYAVEACGMRVLEAEDYIRRYCAAYHIPVDMEKPLMTCPACEHQVGRDSVVCPNCAAPLKGNCPACGAPFEEGPAACAACGFILKDMVKALPYLEDAQGAILDRSWGAALRSLAHVEQYWPGHPEIGPLKARAKQLEERYAWYVDQLNDCIGKNQYYAALDLIDRAKEERFTLPDAIVRQVQKVIEDLEQQLSVLTAQPTPDIDRLMELSGSVADSLELTRLLNRYPPLAPIWKHPCREGWCIWGGTPAILPAKPIMCWFARRAASPTPPLTATYSTRGRPPPLWTGRPPPSRKYTTGCLPAGATSFLPAAPIAGPFSSSPNWRICASSPPTRRPRFSGRSTRICGKCASGGNWGESAPPAPGKGCSSRPTASTATWTPKSKTTWTTGTIWWRFTRWTAGR